MILDEEGEIVAGVRYRVVYCGEDIASYGSGDAREAILRAQMNPPATVLAQAFIVDPEQDRPGIKETAGPWEIVYPPPATLGEGR